MTEELIPNELIQSKIYLIRGQKVMLDRELAELYQVRSIALRQQVKRNIKRFPQDFMFQLTEKETDIMLSQKVIPSKRSLGGALPYVFSEQGVAMLSSVLKSDRAILINIQIMRTFTKLREMLSTHKDLLIKIEQMEQKYDYNFKVIWDVIDQLLAPADEESKKIGFV